MSDLHRGSRFLRLLRSICAKTACVRRAIVALFVAVATILATFMIMPSASMGASQQGEPKQVQTQAEKPENKAAETAGASAKNGSAASGETSAKGDAGDSKTEEPKTVDPKNSQPPAKQDATNADHAQNVDPTKQQQNNAAEGANKAADKDVADAAKDAEKSKSVKRSKRQKRSAGAEDRAAAGNVDIPKECSDAGIDELAKCYVAEYFYTFRKGKRVVNKRNIKINNPGESYTIKPVFRRVKKINNKGIPIIDDKTDASSSVKGLIESFSLERLSTESTALESNVENNDFVKVDPTSGQIKIHANKWLNNGSYYVFVKVKYKDNSTLTRSQWCTSSCKLPYDKYSRFTINIQYKVPTDDVLSLKVYNHQDSKGRAEVKDNGTAASVESDDKGNFKPITPIFIDTTSSKRPNLIYHRMVCHKDGDGTSDSDYHLNSINGLTLSDSADSTSSSQKQWKHVPGDRPANDTLSESSGNLYESDDIIERSQSWISGKPKDDGTFECRVFAIKDVKINKKWHEGMPKQELNSSSTLVKEFDTRAGTQPGMQSLFGGNIVDSNTWKTDDFKQGVDWDVKTIKIQFGGKDLALKVYPFKNSDGSLPDALTDKNNKISAMLGMELKPFVDATSAEDSKNKITLRVLCSKGEKKNAAAGGGAASTGGTGSTDGNSSTGSTGSGSAVSDSSGASTGTGSQTNKPSESTQSAEDFEYKTWSSNLAELGLSVPADDNQNTCHSDKEGDKTCESADPNKKVAARTDKEVSIKPTDVGNYQCVVFALKPKALAKFDGLTGSLTPDSIKSELTQVTEGSPTAFKENMDFAAFMFNIDIDSVSNFKLPKTGGQNWNLQLGAVAAVMVSVLAAGFVISQSEACRKLLYERRRC
ncbi:hypothetical protein [Gardnerella vaginalis]|uniref:hypothetical protein n=1 Tax=Gardnerella vaginalis TaxID=2702 RepID=UPI0039F03B84